MKTLILPYKSFSGGAKSLANSLEIKRAKLEGPSFRNPVRIINWGKAVVPSRLEGVQVEWLNKPENVELARNKLLSFRLFKEGEVSTVPWTEDKEEAQRWLSEGHLVVVRQSLEGQSGAGIVLVNPGETIPDAPLYTKYTKKKHGEWRVHVVDGKVIDFARKRRRNGVDGGNNYIRSHHHGWVFCRVGEELPQRLKEESIKAVAALGLDFGAVDTIYNGDPAQPFVLEINTAPGLEGTTLNRYTAAFRELLAAQ